MMKRSQSTGGATLILVVLLTLLLLSIVLAATMRLGLTSRLNSADQKSILLAQYRAESGVSLARSRLRDIQRALAPIGQGNVSNYLIPGTTPYTTLKLYAEAFCAKSANVAWTNTSEFGAQDAQGYTYPYAQECKYEGTALNPSQFQLFSEYLNPAVYQIFPVSEHGDLSTIPGRNAFWLSQFDQTTTVDGLTMHTGVRPLRVVKLTDSTYRFYFKVDAFSSRAVQGGATRNITGQPTRSSEWWVQIQRPPLLDNVLDTMHQKSKDGTWVGFDNQVFDGPVHTNEAFSFFTGATAVFKGKISSAGCDNVPAVPDSTYQCSGSNRNPKIYRYGTTTSSGGTFTANATDTTDAARSETLKNKLCSASGMTCGAGGMQFLGGYDFAASYKPYPQNINDQQAAALGYASALVPGMPTPPLLPDNSVGLTLPDNADLKLYVANASGVEATFNSAQNKWVTDGPEYQYIKVSTAATAAIQLGPNVTVNTPALLRVDSNGKIQYSNDNGVTWVDSPENRKFNGVIYSAGGINSVTGGVNTRVGTAAPTPALASFSQVTVAAQQTVRVQSDLVMADPPCKLADFDTNTNCPNPKNVLGVYSNQGDVEIGNDAPNDLQLQAALMSSGGQVYVVNRDRDRGVVHLTGALVENYYGAFRTDGLGYGRDFSHDKRFKQGLLPPYFPTSPSWTTEDGANLGLNLENLSWKQDKS